DCHVTGVQTCALPIFTVEGTWTDVLDDPGLAHHEERAARGIAFVTPVVESQRLGILLPADLLPNGDIDWVNDRTIRVHGNRHERSEERRVGTEGCGWR